jgi:hypothetical protein
VRIRRELREFALPDDDASRAAWQNHNPALNMEQRDDGVAAVIAYNKCLFDPGWIAALARDYEALLREWTAAPGERLSRIALPSGV